MTTTDAPTGASAKTRETIWCGCDVAKASFDAALWLPDDDPERAAARPMKAIPVHTFERSPEGVREWLRWADAQRPESPEPFAMRVVMEATGKYSLDLAVWMLSERAALAPAIINPETARAFNKSLALRNKTDKTDARALARFGAERRPAPLAPPSPAMAELRALTRHRQSIIEMRVAEENRLGECGDSPTVARMIKSHVVRLRKDEERAEKEIRRHLEALPDALRDAQAIDGIYGVGFVTAATVVAELGDLRRFEAARQLTAFVGLSPRRNDSGPKQGPSRLCKKGSPRLRKALYMPALTIIGGDNDLADCYRRLVAQGKPKKAALAVVMRKLLVLMRAVLISGEIYEKHHRKTCAKPVEKGEQKTQLSA
jgi:transposase